MKPHPPPSSALRTPPHPRKLYVTGFPSKSSSEDLTAELEFVFSKFGGVEETQLFMNSFLNRTRRSICLGDSRVRGGGRRSLTSPDLHIQQPCKMTSSNSSDQPNLKGLYKAPLISLLFPLIRSSWEDFRKLSPRTPCSAISNSLARLPNS